MSNNNTIHPAWWGNPGPETDIILHGRKAKIPSV